MMKHSAEVIGLALASFTSVIAQAQPAETPGQVRADQQLAHEKAEERAAYASHDPARIARERAEAREAYARDWGAHHPPTPEQIAREDQRLAQAKAAAAKADRSHDTAWKARAKAELKAAYAADWNVHHWQR